MNEQMSRGERARPQTYKLPRVTQWMDSLGELLVLRELGGVHAQACHARGCGVPGVLGGQVAHPM